MMAIPASRCRVDGCREPVLAPLAGECLCLNHFLEHAFSGIIPVQEACNRGEPLAEATLADLLAAARHVSQLLVGPGWNPQHHAAQQERILELLLSVAHLHEYAAHHPGTDPVIN